LSNQARTIEMERVPDKHARIHVCVFDSGKPECLRNEIERF
jgi:hypothetical protein